MRMYDLGCGQGGGAKGYHDAGFTEIVGVDTNPEWAAYYPYEFVNMDAIEFLLRYGNSFDFGHLSPTCTGYSRGTAAIPDRYERYDRQIPAWRTAALEATTPFVIENVRDAAYEMLNTIMLCGRMPEFTLEATDTDDTPLIMDRHRLFEPHGITLEAPIHYPHDRTLQVAGAYSGARRDKWEARHIRKGGYVPKSVEVQATLLGIDWMTEAGLWLSIPPAYTEYIGRQVIAQLSN